MKNYYKKTHVPGFDWMQWIAIYKYKVDVRTSFLEKVYYTTNSFHFKVFMFLMLHVAPFYPLIINFYWFHFSLQTTYLITKSQNYL